MKKKLVDIDKKISKNWTLKKIASVKYTTSKKSKIGLFEAFEI